MNRSSFFVIATLAVFTFVPQPVGAQVAFGARFGGGSGSAKYNVGEINARLRAAGAFYVTGSYQIIGGYWACTGGDVAELRCSYDGNSISVGGVYAAVDASNVYFAVGGSIGSFLRTGGQTYSGKRHLTGNVTADTEVRVWGPFRIQFGVAHRRIFDETYSAAFDTSPHFTSMTGGVSFVFGAN